jgi:TM2 domain-containing membrane protein YozV
MTSEKFRNYSNYVLIGLCILAGLVAIFYNVIIGFMILFSIIPGTSLIEYIDQILERKGMFKNEDNN